MSAAASLPASQSAARHNASLVRRPVGAGRTLAEGVPTKRVFNATMGTAFLPNRFRVRGPSGDSGSSQPDDRPLVLLQSGSPNMSAAVGRIAWPTRSSMSSPLCHSSTVTQCASAQPMSGSDIAIGTTNV